MKEPLKSGRRLGDYVRGFEDAIELAYSITIEKQKYSDFKKDLSEILRKLKERKYAFIYEKIVIM